MRACTSTGALPANLDMALAKLPQNGDSSSWVLRGSEWVGMVVASDKGLFGYALAGDSLVADAKVQFGRALRLS